jgi:hypothetical protein
MKIPMVQTSHNQLGNTSARLASGLRNSRPSISYSRVLALS